MSDPYNPPAFPRIGEGFGNPRYDEAGMTLRDYFATHAPPTPDWFFDSPRWLGNQLLAICAWNYAYADTMLAERRK